MSKMNKWHKVTKKDQKRVFCESAECGKRAKVCEHAEWNTGNTSGISFWYYCMAHGKQHGFTGKREQMRRLAA